MYGFKFLDLSIESFVNPSQFLHVVPWNHLFNLQKLRNIHSIISSIEKKNRESRGKRKIRQFVCYPNLIVLRAHINSFLYVIFYFKM